MPIIILKLIFYTELQIAAQGNRRPWSFRHFAGQTFSNQVWIRNESVHLLVCSKSMWQNCNVVNKHISGFRLSHSGWKCTPVPGFDTDDTQGKGEMQLLDVSFVFECICVLPASTTFHKVSVNTSSLLVSSSPSFTMLSCEVSTQIFGREIGCYRFIMNSTSQLQFQYVKCEIGGYFLSQSANLSCGVWKLLMWSTLF